MTASQKLCLAALALQALVRDGRQWKFGKRAFSNQTVRALIDRGLAKRLGDSVVGTLGLNDNGQVR